MAGLRRAALLTLSMLAASGCALIKLPNPPDNAGHDAGMMNPPSTDAAAMADAGFPRDGSTSADSGGPGPGDCSTADGAYRDDAGVWHASDGTPCTPAGADASADVSSPPDASFDGGMDQDAGDVVGDDASGDDANGDDASVCDDASPDGDANVCDDASADAVEDAAEAGGDDTDAAVEDAADAGDDAWCSDSAPY